MINHTSTVYQTALISAGYLTYTFITICDTYRAVFLSKRSTRVQWKTTYNWQILGPLEFCYKQVLPNYVSTRELLSLIADGWSLKM